MNPYIVIGIVLVVIGVVALYFRNRRNNGRTVTTTENVQVTPQPQRVPLNIVSTVTFADDPNNQRTNHDWLRYLLYAILAIALLIGGYYLLSSGSNNDEQLAKIEKKVDNANISIANLQDSLSQHDKNGKTGGKNIVNAVNIVGEQVTNQNTLLTGINKTVNQNTGTLKNISNKLTEIDKQIKLLAGDQQTMFAKYQVFMAELRKLNSDPNATAEQLSKLSNKIDDLKEQINNLEVKINNLETSKKQLQDNG
ncbi:MAG: hypothetical protein WC621_01915 [Patescibacteria group bacterium]